MRAPLFSALGRPYSAPMRMSARVSLASILFVSCLLLRLQSLGAVPLLDPSEGRYATIVQEMVQTGDLVTPTMIKDGVRTPFLGKPPLYFWLASLSAKVLGSGEFAVRLPSFLALLGSVAAVILFCRGVFPAGVGMVAAILLCSSCLTFIFSAACMLDPLLTCFVSLSYLAFARFAKSETEKGQQRWGLLVALALGCGFMTKGPVAIALPAIGIGLWIISFRKTSLLRKVPWVKAFILGLLIILPWFIVAELRNPGFIKYFFVNENALRFLASDYGDRYGSGHTKPYGTIWLMLVAGFFPAVLLLLALVVRARRASCVRQSICPWMWFALLWGLSPALLFTFGRQVSFAYVLPGIPGLAIFTAAWLAQLRQRGIAPISDRAVVKTGAAVVLLLWLVTLVGAPYLDRRFSSLQLVQALERLAPSEEPTVLFMKRVPYSASFYAVRPGGTGLSLGLLASDGGDLPTKGLLVLRGEKQQLPPGAPFVEREQVGEWRIFTSIEAPPSPGQ